MKKTLLLLCASACATGAFAQTNPNGSGQVSITSGTGLTYVQNFDGLDSATTASTGGTTLPSGWYVFESGTSGSVDGKYRSGNGSSNAGDTYSFGTPASADRAIGSQASGSLTPYFGVKFVNNTGAVINSVSITHMMEEWRVGDTSSRPDTTYFEYSTSASGIGDTAAANWMDVPAMMLNSIVTNASSANGNALDGNLAANRRNITGTLTVNVPVGGMLYFRWKDKNIVGSDDGLAVDDFNVAFSTTQSVGNVAVNNLPLTLLGNGTTRNVQAAFTAPETGSFTLTVTDLTGRVIAVTENAATKGQLVSLPVSSASLAAGTYLVRVAQGSFTGIAKLSVN